MFTGIVQAVGEIVSVRAQSELSRSQGADSTWTDEEGLRLRVTWGGLDTSDVREGDSIALNGACMTVISPDSRGFEVDISRESLRCTSGLDVTGPVNLEKAMRASDRLGGHMVSGHVDARGEVISVERRAESIELVVRIPSHLAPFVTEKGSITLHGVSLTVNRLRDDERGTDLWINLIPHTWSVTTLGRLQPNDFVNVEVDAMSRQISRLLERQFAHLLASARGSHDA